MMVHAQAIDVPEIWSFIEPIASERASEETI